MDVQTAVISVLKDLIVLAGTVLLSFITNYLHRYYTVKQIETAKSIAVLAVTFVEQVAAALGLTNPEMLQMAIDRARMLAAKIGINLTDQQWETLIEAALGELKDIWAAPKGSNPGTGPGAKNTLLEFLPGRGGEPGNAP